MDAYCTVSVLTQTPEPERVMYQAMHQDYCAEYVSPESGIPANYGEVVVKRLLEGNRGHYGPLEHPQISFAVGFFPHTVMQQARTHRVGISFDVQSLRYTGEHLERIGAALLAGESPDLEPYFYVPQTVKAGAAKTRQGLTPIAPEALEIILEQYRQQAVAYYRLVHDCGVPYEDARNIIGYGVRQHFIVSFNCRSLMHFLDLRAKADAQGEIQHLCELLLPHFLAWCPHVAQWYVDNRWGKARLAP